MCVYCMVGDRFSKWDPPFPDWWKQDELIPKPVQPWPNKKPKPWPIDKAKEYLEILKQIKELEDKIGCPCEPNKADYIKLLQEYIDRLK